ncbi:MAG: hypothetical protein R3F34_07135 [Planctomycetota bacterium]
MAHSSSYAFDAASPSARRTTVGTRLATSFALVGAVLASCGGSSATTKSGGSSTSASMVIAEVNNGFGPVLPYFVYRVDPNTDTVTSELMAIRSVDDILNNVREDNPILPPAQWDDEAVLPNGFEGNHFVAVRFTQDIALDSVLDLSPSAVTNNFLSTTLSIVAYDPASNTTENVSGRVFINGMTPSKTVQASGLHDLEQWVQLDANGVPELLDQSGLGFPGTTSAYSYASNLFNDRTLVFVADDDDDLSTPDAFPVGRQIKVVASTGVRSTTGQFLAFDAVASSTVGDDTAPPRVATQQIGLNTVPRITPGNGSEDVDPATTIEIEFTEPVQPATLGTFDKASNNFEYGSAFQMTFGPPDFLTTMQYKVRFASPYNLTRVTMIPAYSFPGSDSSANGCSEYSRVDMRVADDTVSDISGNMNTAPASTFFVAGSGRVIANAPVLPDVIYVGRKNPAGMSVLDLNGFGQGTGSPAFDSNNPWKTGNSRWPLNPNLLQNGAALTPKLFIGNCTFNGGSSGAMTLARNSVLDTRLVAAPKIASVFDIAVGHSLDTIYNNAPPPLGCQAGNPNACASSGLKNPTVTIAGTSVAPVQPGQFSTLPPGTGNLISIAPHPNPPPLVFPPLCISPFIEAQEPTSIDDLPQALGGFGAPGFQNLLSTFGNPFGNPSQNIPPNGLFIGTQNCWFVGPSRPQSDITLCNPYMMRQQVGHFLYVADKLNNSGEIVVLNSNRMTVLDRIKVADPTNLAMSPNLDILAVTNRIANQVTFIDIDPRSTTFNKILKTIDVGPFPNAIVWQPDNEDILVCNEGDNSISIIRAYDLEVRKTVGGLPAQPVDVAVGPRHVPNFATQRNTYFAFVLCKDGSVSVFESGPDGEGGWGPDSLIGQATQRFESPKRIMLDRSYLTGAVWVAHRNPINTTTQQPIGTNEGALSQLRVTSTVTGQIPVTAIVNLTSRALDLDVFISLNESQLSGVPVDISFDSMLNIAGGAANPITDYSAAGAPAPVNGKNVYRVLPGPTFVPASTPTFMFAAIEDKGVIDVFQVKAGYPKLDVDVTTTGTQSVAAQGVVCLGDYWRQ